MWLAETWSCPAAELGRGWSTAPPVTILEDISKYFLVFLVDCIWCLVKRQGWHQFSSKSYGIVMTLVYLIMAVHWWTWACLCLVTLLSLLNTLLLHNGPKNIQTLEGFEDWIKHTKHWLNLLWAWASISLQSNTHVYLYTKFIIINRTSFFFSKTSMCNWHQRDIGSSGGDSLGGTGFSPRMPHCRIAGLATTPLLHWMAIHLASKLNNQHSQDIKKLIFD